MASQENKLKSRIKYNPDIFGEQTITYELTTDSEIDESKTYYTRSGLGTEESPYVYEEVEEPIVANISTYYERICHNCLNYQQVIEDLLEDSKHKALATLYPFEDYSVMELPSKYNNWQIRASIELYNLADKSMFSSYSENGISFSKFTDGLSIDLMNELTPRVGTPKRTEER